MANSSPEAHPRRSSSAWYWAPRRSLSVSRSYAIWRGLLRSYSHLTVNLTGRAAHPDAIRREMALNRVIFLAIAIFGGLFLVGGVINLG